MRILLFSLWLFFGSPFSLHAQVAAATDSLKKQAASMGQAFVAGDYNLFTSYLYPRIIELSGGAAKVKATLKEAVNDMARQGMEYKSIRFDAPSAMIKTVHQLQCTLPEQIEIKLRMGRAVSKSTLIAISSDNGIHWHFVDTYNKTLDVLKKILPNLSSALVIPPQEQPVHYND